MIDFREDGVRVTWSITFKFGEAERGTLRLDVPAEYLVENVEGKNVRGWDLVPGDQQQALNIELLKAVKQTEQLTVHLSHRREFAVAAGVQVLAPMILVPDAALHSGIVQFRRSVLLELRTDQATGVSRTDADAIAQQMAPLLSENKSPLGVRDYQTYEFHAMPCRIGLTVSPVAAHVAAELRTLFRLGETEASLESDIQMLTQHRAVHEVKIAIPSDLDLEQVSVAI